MGTFTSGPMAVDYYTGSPSPVRDVSYSITGTKGSTTYFYWVVANYSWGSVAPIAPLIVANAPDILGGGNAVVLSWLPPSVQIVSYTVLRTITPTFPGTSTTAVGSATLTATTVTDSGVALVAATFTAIPAMRAVTYIDGTGPTPILVTSVGMQVAGALQIAGPISATAFNTAGATEGTIPGWKAYSVVLVGSNWQITGPDGAITTVPTAAATSQDVPFVTVPPNAFFTDCRFVPTAGPAGGTTTATVPGLGILPTGGSFLAAIGLSLKNAPSNANFQDVATTVGLNAQSGLINVPLTISFNVQTTGGNVNAITPPCAFVIYLLWGVTN